MSLKLLQPGIQPLGQFAGLNSDTLTMKGGEIVSFASVTTSGQPGVTQSGTNQGPYDTFDGYINVSGTFKAPAVSRLWNGTTTLYIDPLGSGRGSRPIMLSDEGIIGYGTLFGTVVGGTVGQQSNGPLPTQITGAILGPHTATGSGKVTCWDKPGLYAVSLDATDGYLQPTNTGLFVSNPLTFTSLGLLTPISSPTSIPNGPVVAHLVEFNTNQSLVTTPNYLVAALNSPSGNVSSVQPRAFAFATIYFAPPLGNNELI
jgi:hypothetical protein